MKRKLFAIILAALLCVDCTESSNELDKAKDVPTETPDGQTTPDNEEDLKEEEDKDEDKDDQTTPEDPTQPDEPILPDPPTINPTDRNNNGIEETNVADYGIINDAFNDQSAKMQEIIDKVATENMGGEIYIPAGTICLTNILMRSNVHIIVDGGATLKIYYNGERAGETMFTFSSTLDKEENSYIENCSIEGLNGARYKVDFKHVPYSWTNPKNGSTTESRAVFVSLNRVKNFTVADANIYDNYTKINAITTSASNDPNAKSWMCYRPTGGVVKNIDIYNCHKGYGLIQMQAGKDIYLENLFANGSCALRMETGAAGINGGIFDIRAKNIRGTNTNTVVLVNPHNTANGRVEVDGVSAESASFAVVVRSGYPDSRYENSVAGYYEWVSIKNVHATFGYPTVADSKNLYVMPYEYHGAEYAYKYLRNKAIADNYTYIGVSSTAIFDTRGDVMDNDKKRTYPVEYLESSITIDGFPARTNPIMRYEDSDVVELRNKYGKLNKSIPIISLEEAESRAKRYY